MYFPFSTKIEEEKTNNALMVTELLPSFIANDFINNVHINLLQQRHSQLFHLTEFFLKHNTRSVNELSHNSQPEIAGRPHAKFGPNP